MNVKPWITQAARLHEEPTYTYEHFAKDLVRQLTWNGAVDVATALRGHVYGWSSGHALHQDVKPLYDRLGWEQAALIASYFRNLGNKPQHRPGSWPTSIGDIRRPDTSRP